MSANFAPFPSRAPEYHRQSSLNDQAMANDLIPLRMAQSNPEHVSLTSNREYQDLPFTLQILKAIDQKLRRERGWRNLEGESESDSNAPIAEDLIEFD